MSQLTLKSAINFLLKPYVLIILILAPITLWVYLEELFPQPPTSPQAYVYPRKKPLFTNQKKTSQHQADLTKTLDKRLSNLKGDYALIIKDLTSSVSYTKNEQTEFTSASIYKLAIMYKIYELSQKSQLQLQSEVAPGLSTQKALEKMITVSDNDSALILASVAGWKNTQTTLESAGIVGFKLSQETPTTTAKATSDLLEHIYQNQAVSAQASKEMKQLLVAQQINDRIPKYLPTDVKVAHKTGELDDVRHDAAIVFGKKSDYIFVILSKTPTPGEAVENIAQLAKTAYDILEEP